jgi:Membrane bound beta barrel domain (DUF5777)
MTNFALVLLSFTLSAEGATDPAGENTVTPAETAAPAAASETTAKPPEAPAAPAPAPIAKPSESDVETLSEVPDLQETESPAAGWYGKGFPEPVRVLALPTARTVRKGGFDFVIDHRASQAIYNKDSKHPWADMGNNFLGFDGSLQVGLGLRYGVIDDLDVGIYRAGTSATDTYEFDVRYRALSQDVAGIDVGVRGGLSWFSQPSASDAHGFYGQILATRLLLNRVLITAGWLYHSNSTNDRKYNEDRAWSTAGAVGVEARLAAAVALDAEFVSCVAGYCSKKPAFSAGVKYLTSRHTFALVCGNTQYLTADGYLTNTDRAWSKLVIGFNITREY